MQQSDTSPLQFQNEQSSDVNFVRKCLDVTKSQIWVWHILQQDFEHLFNQMLDVFAA